MRFCLPEPIHGWREFAGEVGIIVIGVLIALGAEQIVETLHGRERARETEAALKAEIQTSADDVAERIAVDKCLRDQLVSLRGALDDTAPSSFVPAADGLRVFADLYATPWRAWARGGWESAAASAAFNRLPTERVYAYAQIYEAIEDMEGIVRRERDAKGALAPILARNMTSEESRDVLVVLTNLDRARADMLVAGRDLLTSAAVLDILPKADDSHSVAAFASRYKVCGTNST